MILLLFYLFFPLKHLSGVDSVLIKEEFRRQIIDTYIRCHLGAPDGIRGEGATQEKEEEIDESEEDDKSKHKDQLSSIGAYIKHYSRHPA